MEIVDFVAAFLSAFVVTLGFLKWRGWGRKRRFYFGTVQSELYKERLYDITCSMFVTSGRPLCTLFALAEEEYVAMEQEREDKKLFPRRVVNKLLCREFQLGIRGWLAGKVKKGSPHTVVRAAVAMRLTTKNDTNTQISEAITKVRTQILEDLVKIVYLQGR